MPSAAVSTYQPEPTEAPTTQAPTPAAPPVAPATTAAAAAGGSGGGSGGGGTTACGAGYYRNVDGNCVPRPAPAPAHPAGATAQCNDGTYSYSQHRQGTCSHHGGVRIWY